MLRTPKASARICLKGVAPPSLHSVTNHLTRPAIVFQLPAQRDRLPSLVSERLFLYPVGVSQTSGRPVFRSGLHLE